MNLILAIPTLAVRREASHRSELVNQILFGESIEQIEQHEEWLFIKTSHDDYKGWIENKSFYFANKPIEKSSKIISSFSALISNENTQFYIPFGSIFRGSEKELIRGSFIIKCEVKEALILIQSEFIGAPYLWGGRTGYGIDCSGLTQLFYRLQGINIPRDAHLQVSFGDDIFLSQVVPGDLLFYKNGENKIVHVGIALDSKSILHASGIARIDEYNEKGIFNKELDKYTHAFALAKRIIIL